jgi:inner membrane protein
MLFGVLCTVLPDIDAIGFWLGVPYGSPWGHRGLTHSIPLAAALAGVITAVAFRGAPSRATVFLFLLLCGASHGLLDAMTDGGRGVALFAPLDEGRYFLPWRPIPVSPIGVHGFFGRRGLTILQSEIPWIWLPCLALAVIGWAVRSSRSETKEGSSWK